MNSSLPHKNHRDETKPVRGASESGSVDPVAVHAGLSRRFADEMAERERQSSRMSLVRLLAFLACAVLIAAGVAEGSRLAWAGGLASAAGFVLAVVAHLRVLTRLEGARIRKELHDRHSMRLTGEWTKFENRGERLLPQRHAYAWDIDLVGQGSLFQRIDVTRTLLGEHALGEWLGRAATLDTIRARQLAVSELAQQVELRQELEAAARLAQGQDKLDGRGFREFAELPSYFAAHPWLTPVIFALPLTSLLCYVLGMLQRAPAALWLLPLCAQIALLWRSARAVRTAFDLAAARQGVAEAFEQMLIVVERARFESPLLRSIQQRLAVDGIPPSRHMRALKGWSSSAELRQQFLFYVLVNPLTLWDLHVLRGLERWNQRVGRRTGDWFAALGELEALSSLATLAFGDPDAHMPEVGPAGGPLTAQALGHPLLASESRVSNDLELAGPGCALIVTGSNMAGKSTLLRALGVNVALALAGGPVCAKALRVPLVRLRASMRADDSLESHASYFQAELLKLRTVVEQAELEPPVLFLLDELLRGTNARARHVGARAVLLHLLKRSALGLVATHDVALSELEREYPGQIRNVHFTDVIEDGEMRFDYRLREGVVRTSNALRLLALAGIDVAADDTAVFDAEDKKAVPATATASPSRSEP